MQDQRRFLGSYFSRPYKHERCLFTHVSLTVRHFVGVWIMNEGGLPFIATFHLHLSASGTNTLVTVIASDTEVINGNKFGLGPCGPGKANIYISV